MTEKFQTNCKYCSDDGMVPGLLNVASLASSSVFLLPDAEHPGRCVVAASWHVRELFELSPARMHTFMDDVNLVASALSRVGACDKVNIALYGDMSDHVHAHVVPKWRGTQGGGQIFSLQPNALENGAGPTPFSGLPWQNIAGRLRDALSGMTSSGG